MRAGWAQTTITPPVGISLAGFGARKEGARGIHDHLYARALVLEEAGRYIALALCDLCEVDTPFVGTVRARVQKVTGIPGSQFRVAATHTHAAPATFALYSTSPDPQWLGVLGDRVADAVVAASRNIAPVTLAIGQGHEGSVAHNRRHADGPVDSTLTVLRGDCPGKPPGLLVHYACHPTVLGPDNLLISRDYVGFVVDAVERDTGWWARFANGACAEINVGHSADLSALGLAMPGRTFERAEALGRRLADEAVRVLGSAQPVEAPHDGRRGVLASGARSLRLPLRQTPSMEDSEELVRTLRRHLRELELAAAAEDALTAARLELVYAELAWDWVRQRGTLMEEPVEVQAFAIGDVALVALPGEFFAESGLRLRERSPFQHTIPIGYADGGVGYVPPASAFAEGGYETRLAPWSRVAPEAEALVIGAAVDLLRELRDG